MPKHFKPRRDYPDVPDIDPEHLSIFAGAAFDHLCADWQIQADQRDELQKHLERAAAAYFRNKVIYDGMPKAGEKRAALAEIAALAGKLSNRLEGLDPFTAGLFWRPEAEIAGYAVQGKPSPYGHRFSEMPGAGGEIMTVYSDRDDLAAAVRVLENYARHARANIPAGRNGRPGMVALRNWVGNVADLWERIFARPFTVDFHGNAPTSDAAVFCWATVQILDPSVTFAQARTAMRDQVRTANARTARNRGKISP
jgi:hypothetical protein